MGRRIFPLICSMFILAACAFAQQNEIYIEQIHSVEAFKAPILQCAISTKSNLLAVVSSEKMLRLYEVPSLKEKSPRMTLAADVRALSFSASGKSLALGAGDGQVHLFDVTNAAIVKSFPVHSQGIQTLLFQDEGWVFSAGVNKTVTITDVIGGTTIGSLPVFPEEVTTLAIPPDAKNGVAGLSNGQVCIFSIGSLLTTAILNEAKTKVTALSFNADGKLLAAGYESGEVFIWNAETGILQMQYKHTGSVLSLAFDPQTRWIVSTSNDNTMKFYDLAVMTNVKTVNDSSEYMISAIFYNDETLLTGTSSGQIKRWRVALAPPDSTNPGIVMEQPVHGTVTAKAFAQEYELRGLAFDDVDVQEVTVNGTSAALSAITPADAVKIPEGMKSIKRFHTVVKLDSIGINPYVIRATDKARHSVSFNGEIQRLSNDQALEIESPMNNSEMGEVSLPVRFRAWFDIAEYSISNNMNEYVNGQVPSLKVVGDEISERVSLFLGYNQIQLSVTSKSGEKYSKILSVNRTLSAAPSVGAAPIPVVSSGIKKSGRVTSGPQRWAVVVGVSEYMNSGIPSLKYADKDAEALANFLRTPEGGGYDSDHMRVLLNKDATLANVRNALINFLNQAIDMDLVLIYFAGHGAPEPARPQNIYLLTSDSDPTALGTTAFPMWDIQTVLARYINAKRVIVFSDACHSGNISVNFATRGVGVTEQNLVNQYLTDLSKSKEGVVVFTASASGEVSQEFPEMAHGVFTYYLLEGAQGKADYDNDYTVTINELMQYVEEQVKRKTRGAQNPTRSQTTYDKEMTISVLPH